jgi:hypothetical protein
VKTTVPVIASPQGTFIRCRCGEEYSVNRKPEFVQHAKNCSPPSNTPAPAPAEEQLDTEGLDVRICSHCNEQFVSDTVNHARTHRDRHVLREHTTSMLVTYRIKGRCLDYSLLLNLRIVCF